MNNCQETPNISIIIPLFNRKVLIKDTLDSLIWQSFMNWECIIVDDGSEDGSVEVIEEYIKLDNRFKLLSRNREPKGAPTCRNIGLLNSCAEFVIFLDSDDLLLPWSLQERYSNISKSEEIDAYLSQSLMVYKDIVPKLRNNYNCSDYLLEIVNFRPSFQTTCPIWRKSFLIDNEIFWREGLPRWQDPFFHITCLINGMKYVWIQKVPDHLIRSDFTDNVRITGTGKSYNSFEKLLDGFIEAYIMVPNSYKKDFANSIVNKVWSTLYFIDNFQIRNIHKKIREMNLFSTLEGFKFLFLGVLYHRFKSTPLIRKILYELIKRKIKIQKKTRFAEHDEILVEFNKKLQDSSSSTILEKLSSFNLRNNTN